MTTQRLYVKDFTKDAYNRYEDDGDGSGEEYRKKFLVPALNEFDSVIVNLDGVNDEYGSSFQVEAFANLIRKSNFKFEDLKKRLTIESDKTSWVDEVWTFIEEAKRDTEGSSVRKY